MVSQQKDNKMDLKEIKAKRYGRSVDDFFVVSNDYEQLLYMIPDIENFLKFELGLTVNEKRQ